MNPHAVITSSRLGFHTTYNTEAVGCQHCAGKRERLARFSFGSGEAAGLLRRLDVVRLGDEHLAGLSALRLTSALVPGRPPTSGPISLPWACIRPPLAVAHLNTCAGPFPAAIVRSTLYP